MSKTPTYEGSLKTTYGGLLKMALPIMFGTFVSFIVVLIDNAFLSRYSQDDFNAAGIGGLIYVALFMLGVGLSSGVQIMIARRAGERRYKEIGNLFNHSLVLLMILAAILWALLYFVMPSVLEQTMASEALFNRLEDFLVWRPWGFFVSFVNLALVAFYVGIGRTQVLVYAMILTSATNILLDYGLIFGNWGFPEMGVGGAALASFLSESAAMIFAVLYTIFNKKVRQYCLLKFLKIYGHIMRKMLSFSWPLMIQQGISLTAYAIFFNFLEQMGPTELEASNVMRTLYLLILVPVLGFSSVTKTYVSQMMAEERSKDVFPILKKITILNVACTGAILGVILLWPAPVIEIINENPLVVDKSISILHVVWGAPIVYAISVVIFSLISGSGDTHTALLIETAIIIVYLVVAWFLAIKLNSSLTTVWMCEYLYFGLLGVVSYAYIRKGKWKTIKF